ncbi:tryptophan synthase subunit alpha [Salininema proteolyticum]|uniref:Tryptophan synthase alpha chain n=1 Tax=Salininema proteolyticum TaxID=1607685 RepID=A0ABV8TXQ3_9ACTN
MTVEKAFARAAEENRGVLVGYLPAGFPTFEDSKEALRVLVDSGIDLIEVGLPYSDPVMDGPAIQRAAVDALAGGFRTKDVFDLVETVSDRVPVAVMTYWNLVERYGVGAFAADFAGVGGAGLITPDLIPEEAGEWVAASDEQGLDRIFLVAPSSTDQRVRETVELCRGFVYAQSVMGVTGARDQVSSVAPALVERTRKHTDLPIGVGLGVKERSQATEIASYADAVIVGSAMVNCYLRSDSTAEGHRALAKLTEELAAGVRDK